MIRTFLEEFVFPILLFLVVRSLLRGFLSNAGRPTPVGRQPAQPQMPQATELKKDPVCGTYVSASSPFTRNAGGQVICFCSKECRDRYAG